jgi:hypothetical protein
VRTGQVELANRRLEWFSRLNLDRLAWCCHDDVTQMKANLIEKLGLLFENFLQLQETVAALSEAVWPRCGLLNRRLGAGMNPADPSVFARRV